MIDVALSFIITEINNYINRKLNPNPKDIVVLEDVTKAADLQNLNNKVILSLINIEEDRISRNPENFVKIDNRVIYKNPKVNLNLYCLFSVNRREEAQYIFALNHLSVVIQFFQFKNVFTHENSPALDSGIDKLIFDLHSVNFEQLNHLWGVLGGKYLPSVMYKMRLITIDDKAIDAEGGLITEIDIKGKDFTH